MDSNDLEAVAEQFPVSYFYVSPEDGRRLDVFRQCAGDIEKVLVNQFVRGWIGRNREYYLDLARSDAKARGLKFKDWGRIVVEQGMEALPDYKQELKFVGPNPLEHVRVPADAERRRLSYITLGKQNIALLRVAIYHDRDSITGFVSRIVREHLCRNWDSLYASQVAAEDYENWED